MEEALTITREELKQKLEEEELNNEHPSRGFALVDILQHEYYEAEHLPGAINIPLGREEDFEARFDKNKDIVIYCASLECRTSGMVAKRLRDRGFTRVREFGGGISEWKEEYATESSPEM